MAKIDKSDEILKQLGKLTEQVALIQAVLLELTRPPGKSAGKQPIRTMDVTLDGFKDTRIEPSDGAGDEDAGYDEADESASKKLVRAAKAVTAKKAAPKTAKKSKR